MSWLLPVTAALVILVLAPHAMFAFDVAPKVVVLVLGVAIALAVSRTPGLAATARTRRGKWFLGIVALSVVSLVIATASSLDPDLSLFGTAWRRFGLLSNLAVILFAVLLAGHAAADPLAVPRFLKATSLAGLLSALYGILQYSSFDPILPAAAYHVGEGIWSIVRPPGTLGHASYYSTFLLYAVFASIALHSMEVGRRWRFVASASVAFGALAIVLSGTRGAILGLVIGAIALLLACRPPIRRTHVVVSGLIFVTGIAFYFSPFGDQLRARARWSQEDAAGGARLLLWKDSLAMAASHPVFGYGPEVFTIEFPRHQSIELAQLYPDFYQESPHNVFLDALCGQGAVGLAALIAVCTLSLSSWKRTPWTAPLAAGFLAALVSQQFGVFTVPTALYFYSTAALLSTAGPAGATRKPVRVFQLVNVAAALGLATFAIQFTISEFHFARAKDLLANKQLDSAIAQGVVARSWMPGGSTYDLYFSRAWLQVSELEMDPVRKFQAWQQGMAEAARAPLGSDDRANALVNLAAFEATTNNAEAVERRLLAAVAQAPNWFRPHWLLARFYLATGHLPEAEWRAKKAVERNGNHNTEVMETYRVAQKARPLE